MSVSGSDSGMITASGASRLPDSHLIDRVVDELRSIERRSGLDRTLAIGEVILMRFFSGNPGLWRDRRRNKNNSIRRLAGRADCPFCRSALNEAVAVYVAVADLPCARTFGHISASHIASVLRLEVDRRSAILERAERERWSVRELRERVVSERRAEGERRGRPSMDAEARAIGKLQRLLQELEHTAASLSANGPSSAARSSDLGSLAVNLGRVLAMLEKSAKYRPGVIAARPGVARRQSA
jgi:hypothetical protein